MDISTVASLIISIVSGIVASAVLVLNLMERKSENKVNLVKGKADTLNSLSETLERSIERAERAEQRVAELSIEVAKQRDFLLDFHNYRLMLELKLGETPQASVVYIEHLDREGISQLDTKT